MVKQNKKKKTLIIGAGSIGLRHARILGDFGCLIAMVTQRSDIELPVYRNTENAIQEFNPDYIIIANETNKHLLELEKICKLTSGKIVLVEKPIFEQVKKFNKIKLNNFLKNNIYVGYNLRYHPFIKYIKELIIKEKFLSCNIYVGQYLPNWRSDREYTLSYSSDFKKGGGVLLELSHEIDYLRLFFGKCIESNTFNEKLSDLKINCIDSSVGILKFERCKHVSFNFNLFDRVGRREIILNSNDTTFKFDLVNNEMITNKNIKKIDFCRDKTYIDMHQDILHNNGKDACSFQEGLEVLDLLDKIYKFQ